MLARLSTTARWFLVGVTLVLSALLMLNAARSDSAIVDELAHIPAGYGYVRYLDYRLNPEHPPLVKALAALPLLFQKLNFPISNPAWQKEVNSQWTVGAQFLYESGNDADKIIFTARIFPIILTLILVIAVYLWSKELIGRWWALLPTFLTAFSPTILAHGHYVTTDVGATFGTLIAVITFLNFLLKPSKRNLVLAGLCFGIAQLAKFSTILLIPYLLILITAFYIVSVIRDWSTTDPARGHFRRFCIRAFRYFRSVFLIFFVGYLLVFVVYLLFTINYPIEKQMADTQAILQTLRVRPVANFLVWLSGIPVLRAFGHYLLGVVMVIQRSAGGNTLYYLGEVTNRGSVSYFPLVFLLKEPIASLILIAIAFLFSLWNVAKAAPAVIFRRSHQFLDYLSTHFAEFSMLTFIVIYWTSSVTSNLNIGVRHILPTLPFIYILTAGAIKKWFSIKNWELARNFLIKIFIVYRELWSISVKSAVLAFLIIWYLVSSLIAAPHFLSYFNFLGGGTRNGYHYVTDSNYDWGQDLKRFKTWVENNLPAGEKIAVDYFGGGNPKYYLGGERVEPWWSARGTPLAENIKWLAVSINTIQVAKGKTVGGFARKPEDEYQWLKEPYKPYDRAGTSIFIYRLE